MLLGVQASDALGEQEGYREFAAFEVNCENVVKCQIFRIHWVYRATAYHTLQSHFLPR